MKELTVEEINNIENGDYIVKERFAGKETEHHTKVEIETIGGSPMATCLGGRICWWLGDFTEYDNRNWLRIYKA